MLLIQLPAFTQIRIGPQFLTEVVQRSDWNPAAMQDVNVQVSLFNVQPFLGNTGFTVNDALVEVPGTDSLEFSLDQLLSKLDETNVIRGDLELDYIGVAINVKDLGMQFSLNIGSRVHSQFGYDDELVGLLVQGNGAYIGETVEGGPQLNIMAYTDIGVSVAKKFGNVFQVGGRLHYLNGAIAVNTLNHEASLTTSPEFYQLELELDYELMASFPNLGVLDSLAQGVINETGLRPSLNLANNHGFSFDLSTIIRPVENMELSIGAQGLGQISWKNNAQKYSSQSTNSFEGYEPKNQGNEPIFERLLELDFGGIADTLSQC